MYANSRSLGGLVESAHEIVIAVKVVLLVVAQGYLAAAVLGEEHCVALLDGDRLELAIVKGAAGPHGDDRAEVELLGLALRQQDTTLGLREGLTLLDKHTVHQRTQLLEGNHLVSRKFNKYIIASRVSPS